MDEDNDIASQPEFGSDPLGSPLPPQAGDMEAAMDLPISGPDSGLPDDGELANDRALAMDDLQSATEEEDIAALVPVDVPELQQEESPEELDAVEAAVPSDMPLARRIEPKEQPHRQPDKGQMARKHRRAMNKMQADTDPQDDIVAQNPNRAGMDDQDFEVNTFPGQTADGDNSTQRWNEYHEANNQFRDAIVDHLGIETELLTNHQHQIQLLTEQLMRCRY